jgi:hypothetical protein
MIFKKRVLHGQIFVRNSCKNYTKSDSFFIYIRSRRTDGRTWSSSVELFVYFVRTPKIGKRHFCNFTRNRTLYLRKVGTKMHGATNPKALIINSSSVGVSPTPPPMHSVLASPIIWQYPSSPPQKKKK